MIADVEPKSLGILLPKGKHITPITNELLDFKGIKLAHVKKNGTEYGDFADFDATWSRVDSGNVFDEVARGTHFQGGLVGSDFRANYLASLTEDETPEVEELFRFDNAFDARTRLSVLTRNNDVFQSGADLEGGRFITRYKAKAQRYLGPFFPDDTEIPVDIDTSITGGEEVFVVRGAAIAAMVIVISGGTKGPLLKELEVVEEHIQPIFVANLLAAEERGYLPELEKFVDSLKNGVPKRGSTRFTAPFEAIASAPISAALMVVASVGGLLLTAGKRK